MGRRSMRMGVTAVVVAAVVALSGCQWVMVGFDGGRSGFNRFESTIGVGEVDELTELWSAPIGGDTVVAGGRVYAVGAIGPQLAPVPAFQVYDALGVEGCTGTPA